MTDKATPLNLSFRSLGDDAHTLTEEYFIIDDNILIFNQDLVHIVEIKSSDSDGTCINLHLQNGITIEKKFLISKDIIKEI